MSLVGVVHYQKFALRRGDDVLKDYPLARRMGDLQKAVVANVQQFRRERPNIASAYLGAPEVPLHYATACGEIKALIAIVESILEKSLPVSPKEFQHSVHNASIAYVAMAEKIHNPTYVTTSGFLSSAKAFFYSASRIAHGLDGECLLIHGAEYDDAESDILAVVEVAALAPSSTPGARVFDVQRHMPPSAELRKMRALKESEAPFFWLDLNSFPEHGVLAMASSGEAVSMKEVP